MQTYTHFGKGWQMRQIIDGCIVQYEVTINNEDMAYLVRKACRNKSLRSKVGPVTVKIHHKLPAQGETPATAGEGRTLSR